MSEFGNNFDKAQRAYDNVSPPEDTRIECDKCDGDGTLAMSDCCESEVINQVCTACNEQCGYAKCDKCKGEGLVEPTRKEDDYDEDDDSYIDSDNG